MKIGIMDLGRQYESIKDEVDAAVKDALQSQKFILGPNTEAFEKEFAKYCGAKYAVGVASGSDALILALKALQLRTGSEVVTTPYTFISTVDSVTHNGLKPVFADIGSDYNINTAEMAKKITASTTALLPVHLYGQPADMNGITGIAKEKELKVLEDCCQAHGAEYRGKKVGNFGEAGCFSFYPSKNLGAFGDGGAIITSSKELFERILMLRNYGQKQKYMHELVGYNSRLDDVQAAVLRIKLRHLDKWNEMRRKNAKIYNELLSNVPQLKLPTEGAGRKHVYHLYTVRCKDRDGLQAFLSQNGVGTGIHYPIPVHLTKAYAHLGYKEGSLPTAESYSKEILSLPMFPELTQEEITYVADCVKRFYAQRGSP